MLAWAGLRRYGLKKDADRLTYRWLWAIAKNARDYNGTIPEKLDGGLDACASAAAGTKKHARTHAAPSTTSMKVEYFCGEYIQVL